MRTRSGVGRTEVIIGVVVVVVLAAVAIPLFMGGSEKSREAELPLYVESIRTAEIALEQIFGDYESAAAAPREATEVNATPIPWEASDGFNRLAWSPDNLDAVYGSYRVVLTDAGFNVIGTADVDGDGKRAEFTASEEAAAASSSNPEFR